MARPRGDIRQRIIRAARRRFLADGVAGASLRAIAAEARTSVGMIHYYFRAKDGLFAAVVEEVYAALLADLSAALGIDAPTEARLRRAFERLARLTDDELAVIRLILREALVSSRRRARLVERFSRGHLPLLLGVIGEGVARGELTPRQPPAALFLATVTLAVLPQVLRRLAAETPPPGLSLPSPDALAAALCDVLMRGIAATG